MEPFFSILISTKNRKKELFYTLNSIYNTLNYKNFEVVVYDDGSKDGTSEMILENFKKVILLQNKKSKGYIYCRNKMLNETKADFAISLDDDAHLLIENPFEIIASYFHQHPNCGLIAARIYWSRDKLISLHTEEINERVKGYVGCGHVWRMKAWNEIPNYPEWYQFYGEENYAALQLMKKKWQIHYVPKLVVQHRVNLKERTKTVNDFSYRYRRAIRADWYNILLFYPLLKIPKTMLYSIVMQFKNKISKGNFRVIIPLFLAILDLFLAIPKFLKNRNRLSSEEYKEYKKLEETKIYWKP